jgi:hypothetical protein
MSAASFGIDGGWGGLRTTKAFVSLFADPSGKTDTRAMFYTDGQKLEIEDLTQFSNGYAISKWKNISSTGLKVLTLYTQTQTSLCSVWLMRI